jgi:predicted transposase/invertase (TIGR01784 family)
MADRTLISFDYAVKYLLREQEDYVILSGFLTELMGRKIEVIGLIPEETIKSDPDEKTNRVDLKAQIDGGEIAVFEIQFHQEYDFFGRVLYGVSHAITDQVRSGKLYNVKKVYSINIAYYNLTAKREYLFFGKFSGFQGIHFHEESIPFAQTATKDSKELLDIHPEYYLILPNMFDETLRGKFDEWIYILKNSKVRDDFTAAGIKEAAEKLNELTLPPDKLAAYHRYMENIRSVNSQAIAAEIKGKEEGIAVGKAENQKETVLNMHEAGFSIADIVKATKLSEQEINDILNQ